MRTPPSTSRPAASARPVAGATPIPVKTASALISVPSASRDAGSRVRADQYLGHLGAGPEVDVVLTVQVQEHLGHLWAQHAQERKLRRFDDRHRDPGGPGRGGHLQPDPAGPDDGDPRYGRQSLAQPLAVIHRPQGEDPVGVRSRHRQPDRHRSGGQQQLVVADRFPAGQHKLAQVPVDGRDRSAEPQVNGVVDVPAVVVDEDRLPFLGALEVALGQLRPLVRVVRLRTDEDDLPAEVLVPERFRRPGSAQRGANDHEGGS